MGKQKVIHKIEEVELDWIFTILGILILIGDIVFIIQSFYFISTTQIIDGFKLFGRLVIGILLFALGGLMSMYEPTYTRIKHTIVRTKK